jgi:hypothetical protein
VACGPATNFPIEPLLSGHHSDTASNGEFVSLRNGSCATGFAKLAQSRTLLLAP